MSLNRTFTFFKALTNIILPYSLCENLLNKDMQRSKYRQAAGGLTELSYPRIRSVKSPAVFLLTTYLLRYTLQVAVTKYDIYYDIGGLK
jgi:hypothetical protein